MKAKALSTFYLKLYSVFFLLGTSSFAKENAELSITHLENGRLCWKVYSNELGYESKHSLDTEESIQLFDRANKRVYSFKDIFVATSLAALTFELIDHKVSPIYFLAPLTFYFAYSKSRSLEQSRYKTRIINSGRHELKNKVLARHLIHELKNFDLYKNETTSGNFDCGRI